MTRHEFEQITDPWDLKDFMEDHRNWDLENLITGNDLDQYIENDIKDCLDYHSWGYLYEQLQCLYDELYTGGDYYLCNGSFDYTEFTDDDFEDAKARAREWALAEDLFDPDPDTDYLYDPDAEPLSAPPSVMDILAP